MTFQDSYMTDNRYQKNRRSNGWNTTYNRCNLQYWFCYLSCDVLENIQMENQFAINNSNQSRNNAGFESTAYLRFPFLCIRFFLSAKGTFIYSTWRNSSDFYFNLLVNESYRAAYFLRSKKLSFNCFNNYFRGRWWSLSDSCFLLDIEKKAECRAWCQEQREQRKPAIFLLLEKT